MARIPLSLWLFGLAALAMTSPAQAHHPVFGSLVAHIRPEGVDVLMDLDAGTIGRALSLDTDGNNVASADEFEAGREAVLSYLGETFQIDNAGSPCPVQKIERYETGGAPDKRRLRVFMVLSCPLPLRDVTIGHKVLMEEAGGHRHMAQIQVGERVYSHVFARQSTTFTVDASALSPPAPAPAPAEPEAPWDPVQIRLAVVAVVLLLGGAVRFGQVAARRRS